MDKLSIEQLEEFARDYITIAGSFEKGRELIEEARLELVKGGVEVLDELPSALAEEFSSALIDDGLKKKSREGHKCTSLSDKEEQT